MINMLTLSMNMKPGFGVGARTLAKMLSALGLAAGLLSCGGGDSTGFAIVGTVSGLAGNGLVLQNNGGDDLAIVANGAFTFATRLASGASYAVTVKTQPVMPSQTCTVSNGSGTVTTAAVTDVAVGCVTLPPRFVYVANSGSNTVSAYTIDATSGILTPLAGSPALTQLAPVFVAVDPAGKFAYVANSSSNTVSGYSIDATSGALTPLAGSPVLTQFTPVSIAAVAPTSSAKFAYVVNSGSNTVSGYSIDATSGALTPLAGSPFVTGFTPASVAVDPTGKFAYVANRASNTVSGYGIDATSGVLTPLAGSPFMTGTSPVFVATDPTGKFAYVVNSGSNTVSAYTIEATSGILAPLAGSTTFTTGNDPLSLAIVN